VNFGRQKVFATYGMENRKKGATDASRAFKEKDLSFWKSSVEIFCLQITSGQCILPAEGRSYETIFEDV
jgi:hypothetical protein